MNVWVVDLVGLGSYVVDLNRNCDATSGALNTQGKSSNA